MNKNNINNQQQLLLRTINNYFLNNKESLDILINIISGNSNLSLRLVDWFVTNYSKKFNISYPLDETSSDNINDGHFMVYLNYKAQLKAYSKKHFDPFQRRNRILFSYNEGKDHIQTTIGQLNFFKWAIKNKIIDYVMENYEEIENDMNVTLKLSASENSVTSTEEDSLTETTIKITQKKKRKELSKSANRKMNRQSCTVTLSFD